MLQKDWKYRAAIFTTLGMLGAITLFTFTSIKTPAQTPSRSPTPRATSNPQTPANDQFTDQSGAALDGSVNTQNPRLRSRQNQARSSYTRRRVRNYTQRLPVICSTPIGKLMPWKCPNK